MKKRGKNIHLTLVFSERALYSAIVILLVLVVSVGVYASTFKNSDGVGHDQSEIEEADPTVLDFAKVGTMACSGANLAIKSISPDGTVTCEAESDISSTNELQTISQVLSEGNNAGNKEIVNVNGIRIGHTDSPGGWGIHSTLPIYSASYIRAGGGYRSSDNTAGISKTHTLSSNGCS